MKSLTQILSTQKHEIADRMNDLAGVEGLVWRDHASDRPWKAVVDVVIDDMVHMLGSSNGVPEEVILNKSIQDLAKSTMDSILRHRLSEIPLTSFMEMAKTCRRAIVSLIRIEIPDIEQQNRYTEFIVHYFDQTEMALCREWVRARDSERETQLKEITDERNRFLSLFNSIASPVFLLDSNGNISVMNEAAEQFLTGAGSLARLQCVCTDEEGNLSGDSLKDCSLESAAPWLEKAMSTSCSLDGSCNGCRFDSTAVINGKTMHFSIAASTYNDIQGRFKGTTVVVDDVTQRVDAELQLERERNMAATYLDLVGSIVLALDPSGAVLLLNKTGCETLGYESYEIIGMNWVDTMIPMEVHDEITDYLQDLVQDEQGLSKQHTNYVATKDGQHRLIEWNNRLLTNDAGAPIAILASGTDVTERRRMEDALTEKELWLRNTFVSLGEAVLILTPDKKILDGNPAAEAMFGMTSEELGEHPIYDLHPNPDMSLEYERLTNEAFERGETAHFEFDHMRSNGEIFPTENSVALIMTDEGQLLGIVHTIRDISERKKAETELRDSKDKLSRIFDSIHEGLMTTDMQGKVQMANPAACEIFGYTQEELVGNSMANLYSDENERNGLLVQLAQNDEVNGLHMKVRRRDGTLITLEGNVHIIRDENADPLAIEGSFRDITSRIESEKILREREQQYRAFFEGSHAIMLLEDPKSGRIMDANPAACSFYGYTLDELRAMTTSHLCALEDEEVFKEMCTARSEGRASFIFRHQLADGSLRDVEVYSGPIQIRGNLHHYSIIHDVTSRVKLESDMKRMATTDALTGANNRHQFFHLGEQELRRSNRYSHDMAVLMLDVDYFKSINDNHGHQVGDEVLTALVEATLATLRETDIFGRLGGEEFAAILPETEIESAFQVADRLRTILAGLAIETCDGEMVSFTVSIGVTEARDDDKNIQEALSRADEALYKAKRGGRNRVELN